MIPSDSCLPVEICTVVLRITISGLVAHHLQFTCSSILPPSIPWWRFRFGMPLLFGSSRVEQASSTNYGVRGRLPYPKHACHPTFVSVLTRVILLASHIPEHPQQVHYLFFELFQRRARVNRCHHSFDHHPRSTSLHRVPQVCLMRTRPLHRPEGEVTDEMGGGVRRPRDLRARKLMGRDNQRVMRNVARQTKQGERRTIRARHRQPVD